MDLRNILFSVFNSFIFSCYDFSSSGNQRFSHSSTTLFMGETTECLQFLKMTGRMFLKFFLVLLVRSFVFLHLLDIVLAGG